MKRIKKCEIKFDDGYLVTKADEVVCLPYEIRQQFDMLDEASQMIEYLEAQPQAQPAPNLDGFKRKTLRQKHEIKLDTPMLDKAVAEAKTMLSEIKDQKLVDDANYLCEKFEKLIDFCESEYIFEGNSYPERYDWPTWGNPLEVSADDVVDLIVALVQSPYTSTDKARKWFTAHETPEMLGF